LRAFFKRIFRGKYNGYGGGMRVMLLNHAEMDCLRLAAWCKDLPQNTTQYIHAGTWDLLCELGYIKANRAGTCFHPAAKALDILERAGFHYPQDTRRLCAGAALSRRLELAELTLFLYSMGADVFMDAPHAVHTSAQQTPNETPPQGIPTQHITQPGLAVSFLPSFALRRAKSSNILGGTRLAGFLYAPQTTFVPYVIRAGNAGVYPHAEQAVFSMEYLTGGKAPAILCTGNPDLSALLAAADHAAEAPFRNGAVTYGKAMAFFSPPVCFVPLSKDGARQLRIICRPDYRKALARALLQKEGYAASGYTWCDGISQKTGEPLLIGVDMNLKGFERALGFAGETKLHILLLDFQVEPAKAILKNKKAELHGFSADELDSALGLSGLPEPDFTPYQTKGGDFINVTAFQTGGKP
jgi:hypothetical protein